MTYYLIPRGNISLANDISINIGTTPSPLILSPSLVHYLLDILNIVSTETQYDTIKEEIYTYKHMIHSNKISKTFRIEYNSPSFYEIIEIFHVMNLNTYLTNSYKNICSFHMESTDGSLKAIQHIRKIYKNDIHLDFNSIIKCIDKDPFDVLYKNYAGSMHVITGDSYMKSTHDMILELTMALCMQKKKGILIWKVDYGFSPLMLDIFYWLSSFYEKTFFIKPTFMDVSDSTKYIVCKGFLCEKGNPEFTILYSLYTHIYNHKTSSVIPTFINRILNIHIPLLFTSKIEEINYIFGQSQLEQIHFNLLVIHHKHRSEKLKNINKHNLQKSMDWCVKYQIPYLVTSYIEQPQK
jgi:hypothetical protein